ncbi:hypothetical protein REPUB_Repub04eG0140700 [Reevesia pubescens]
MVESSDSVSIDIDMVPFGGKKFLVKTSRGSLSVIVCGDQSNVPLLSVDNLADQVAEVLDFFGLKRVLCLGVTAGAYILTLFAMKYKEQVLGLILVSPVCKAPTWTEWLYNKVLMNLLYFYGMCGVLKECLLQCYFSKELRYSVHGAKSEIIQACIKLLDERQSSNVLLFL